jgi:hypothetical protein
VTVFTDADTELPARKRALRDRAETRRKAFMRFEKYKSKDWPVPVIAGRDGALSLSMATEAERACIRAAKNDIVAKWPDKVLYCDGDFHYYRDYRDVDIFKEICPSSPRLKGSALKVNAPKVNERIKSLTADSYRGKAVDIQAATEFIDAEFVDSLTMVITGTSGLENHLSRAIENMCIERRKEVVYLYEMDFIELLKNWLSIYREERESASNEIKNIANCFMVIIEGLGNTTNARNLEIENQGMTKFIQTMTGKMVITSKYPIVSPASFLSKTPTLGKYLNHIYDPAVIAAMTTKMVKLDVDY